ncbi:MAG: hypothetical protein GTO55_00495, partial [Armatimonadetes bacterium]|nr:hypothetical protein [Armatimonadota bacterium]NIM23915.1 hypothetical protein [Armatimonadota bacterium]NIM66634.1 hypothetical protein [Armatimonadota bacterium]NIM76302.1 hypothetical protein [Armatimonadota bacterium]NIN05996.1 hypothetical protein [Armatimonadota bacterium]
MRSSWFCLLGIVLLGAGFAAGPLSAGEVPASAPGFAVVDMEKVISGYEAYKQANVEFRRYYMEAERQLEMNRRLRLLEDKEVQELRDLRAIVALSPEQKARLEHLESLSDAREREFVALEQKSVALTAEEEERRQTLAEIAAKRAPDVVAEERRLTEARQKRNE